MIPWLEPNDPLPATVQALGPDSDAPGLLAAGRDLSPARLKEAYRQGIFPWFSEGQPVLWWTTNPRMVLPVAEFKLNRSLRKTIQKFRCTPGCEVRVDTAFTQVMAACASVRRTGQSGTWISPDMRKAYAQWHEEGSVHSFETWVDGQLAGGLYGVCLGRMFFGESMFAYQTDASKIALAALVCFCRGRDIALIDCQQEARHLASLGARPWHREAFEAHVRSTVDLPLAGTWTYHDSDWSQLNTTHIGTAT